MRFLVFCLLAIIAGVMAEESNEVDGKTKCVPDAVFMRYCNVCKCSSDGQSEVCSNFQCDLNRWSEDGTVRGYADEMDWEKVMARRRESRLAQNE